MKRLISMVAAMTAFVFTLPAQETGPDFMRATGKIYVVVAVILTIFLGIILFLVFIDKKLTKLENQINRYDKTS